MDMKYRLVDHIEIIYSEAALVNKELKKIEKLIADHLEETGVSSYHIDVLTFSVETGDIFVGLYACDTKNNEPYVSSSEMCVISITLDGENYVINKVSPKSEDILTNIPHADARLKALLTSWFNTFNM